MTRYLIDIRMMGPVKQQISGLSHQLAEKFRLGNKLVVPHITLAGPFSTDNEQQLILPPQSPLLSGRLPAT